MGYTFTIGEAIFEDRGDGTEARLMVAAEHMSLDEAPCFENDPLTGNGNSRSPGYVVWSEFCEEVGISELFYGQGWDRSIGRHRECSDDFHRQIPIIERHPGFAAINEHDVAFVAAALERYKERYPNATPGFDYWNEKRDCRPIEDAMLARLIWLHFWMDWAVKNCRHPIIENT